MNRRRFLHSAAVSAISSGLVSKLAATAPIAPAAAPGVQSHEAAAPLSRCDVFVYGSTPGGIAAALHAARGGCRVVLACPQRHAGGMLASGLGGLDTRRVDLHSGFLLEYRAARLAAQRQLMEAGVPEWQRGTPGKGGSAPSFIEGIFDRMIEAEASLLEFWRAHHLVSARTTAGRVTEIVLEAEAPGAARRRLAATTFIDATYEGDLAAATGVPYRVGRESREELGEPLAGICYLDSRTGREIVTPDTGSASMAIQAYCARCVFTTDPERRVPFEKPDTYEQHLCDLWPLLEDFTSGRFKNRTLGKPLPGLKWELNGSIDRPTSLNLPGVSWAWPEADRAHRRRLAQFHVDHAASFFWFLQNERRLPSHIRSQWKPAGRHRDEFRDNQHWPWQIYVRQGRRIEGRARVTQHTFTVQKATGLTPRVDQPIAIGEYTIDVHPCHDRRFEVKGCMEGAIWYRESIPSPAQPGQIPYGALLPRSLSNLLVPVALSASHIGMSVVRMEPVWMITGQVAGLAAAEAQRTGLAVADIDPVPLTQKAKLITDPGLPRYS